MRAVLLSLVLSASPLAAQTATVTVDVTDRNQALHGFGASVSSLIYGSEDVLTPTQRADALWAAFREVGINTGMVRLAAEVTANDNADPFVANEAGLDWTFSANALRGVVEPGAPLGFTDAYPAFKISQGYVHAWMIPLRSRDYDDYLDECAENVLLSVRYWERQTGSAPSLFQMFNEPTTGNRELRVSNDPVRAASAQEVIDIVKRAGARLRAEGYADVRFVVPAEETPAAGLARSQRLYDDPEARPFVGALAYHAYPYGSAYASPARILAESGAGQPDPAAVRVRRDLRDLAARFGVPLLMTEVSEGPRNQDFPWGASETVRARALHIHDELRYAGAAGYFGMNLLWDRQSHIEHFGNTDYRDEEDTIVLIDNRTGAVDITGMGYAIGHYARWTSKGAVHLGAESSDDLVRATALHDAMSGRLVVVLINNRRAAVDVEIDIEGGTVGESVEGEASYGTVRWGAAPAVEADAQRLQTTLPAESVVTLSAPLDGPPSETGVLLEAPFPNPASGDTRVAYSLTRSGEISLTLHDALGRTLATVAEGFAEAGRHEATLPAGLAPGVYTVRLRTDRATRTAQLTAL